MNTETADVKFAGALTFSDEGTLFVGDNHNGAIYAFEIPAEEFSGQTGPRSIRNIDAKIAEVLGVRVGVSAMTSRGNKMNGPSDGISKL